VQTRRWPVSYLKYIACDGPFNGKQFALELLHGGHIKLRDSAGITHVYRAWQASGRASDEGLLEYIGVDPLI